MVNSGDAKNIARLARSLDTDLCLLERMTPSDGDFTMSVPTPFGQGDVLISGADKTVVEDRASATFVELQNLVSGLSWP